MIELRRGLPNILSDALPQPPIQEWLAILLDADSEFAAEEPWDRPSAAGTAAAKRQDSREAI